MRWKGVLATDRLCVDISAQGINWVNSLVHGLGRLIGGQRAYRERSVPCKLFNNGMLDDEGSVAVVIAVAIGPPCRASWKFAESIAKVRDISIF